MHFPCARRYPHPPSGTTHLHEWVTPTPGQGASSRPRVAPGGGDAWWAVTGSNRRHPACKAGALPTELTARTAETMGFWRGAQEAPGEWRRAPRGEIPKRPQRPFTSCSTTSSPAAPCRQPFASDERCRKMNDTSNEHIASIAQIASITTRLRRRTPQPDRCPRPATRSSPQQIFVERRRQKDVYPRSIESAQPIGVPPPPHITG